MHQKKYNEIIAQKLFYTINNTNWIIDAIASILWDKTHQISDIIIPNIHNISYIIHIF